MVVSKNIHERIRYNNVAARAAWAKMHASDFTFANDSELGEVVKVEFQKPTGLKEEIRELADGLRAENGLRARCGTAADGPEHDRLEELIIEAHERGWSNADIARALRCPLSSAASRVRNALAKRAGAEAA